MTADRIATRALDAIDRDQPVLVQRAPGFNLLYPPIALAAAVTPRRFRLLLSERVSRWYFRQQ
jgi:hypothetical protein